jgi:hypothetical protein
LRQALELLKERDEFLQIHRDEIRAKIAEGRRSLNRGAGVDGEKVFDRLFEELDAHDQANRE